MTTTSKTTKPAAKATGKAVKAGTLPVFDALVGDLMGGGKRAGTTMAKAPVAKAPAAKKAAAPIKPTAAKVEPNIVEQLQELLAKDRTEAIVEACRLSGLEVKAKKEAMREGLPIPPMPVSEWMTSGDYKERKNAVTSKRTTRGGAGRPAAETHTACPECGHAFSKPKPRCSNKAACARRKAEAKKSTSSTTKAPTPSKAVAKKAPAAKKAVPTASRAARPVSKATQLRNNGKATAAA